MYYRERSTHKGTGNKEGKRQKHLKSTSLLVTLSHCNSGSGAWTQDPAQCNVHTLASACLEVSLPFPLPRYTATRPRYGATDILLHIVSRDHKPEMSNSQLQYLTRHFLTHETSISIEHCLAKIWIRKNVHNRPLWLDLDLISTAI